MIRLPNLDLNTLTLKSAMLVTGQDAVQKWIHNLLQVKISKDIFPSGVKGKTHIAKFPVFDRLHDPICRAMLAVALGCDAFIGGLDKFGPANGICNKKTAGLTGLPRQEEISEAIVKFRSKTRIDKRSLLCYARAIAFEITGDGYTLEAYKDADPELLFKIYLSEIFVEKVRTPRAFTYPLDFRQLPGVCVGRLIITHQLKLYLVYFFLTWSKHQSMM